MSEGILSWISNHLTVRRTTTTDKVETPPSVSAATRTETLPIDHSPIPQTTTTSPLKRRRSSSVNVVPEEETPIRKTGGDVIIDDDTKASTSSGSSSSEESNDDSSLVLFVECPPDNNAPFPDHPYCNRPKNHTTRRTSAETRISSRPVTPFHPNAVDISNEERNNYPQRRKKRSRHSTDVSNTFLDKTSPWYSFQQRLASIPISTSPKHLPLMQQEADLAVLNSIIRSTIAAGEDTSSCTTIIFQDILHARLRRGYKQVVQGKNNLTPGEWGALRTKLAGIWCLYAHVVCEYGKYKLSTLQPEDGTSGPHHTVSLKDFYNHAVCIMDAAASCPFAGTHEWISMCRGRLMVAGKVWSESVTHCEDSFTSYSAVCKDVVKRSCREAAKSCWESMRVCQEEQLSDADVVSKSSGPCNISSAQPSINFFGKLNKSKNSQKDAGGFVQSLCFLASFVEVLGLPSTLDPHKRWHFSQDVSTIGFLCSELNRWSRIGEQVEKNPDVHIGLDEPLGFLESLPLFLPPYVRSSGCGRGSLVNEVTSLCKHCNEEFYSKNCLLIHQRRCFSSPYSHSTANLADRDDSTTLNSGCELVIWAWSSC